MKAKKKAKPKSKTKAKKKVAKKYSTCSEIIPDYFSDCAFPKNYLPDFGCTKTQVKERFYREIIEISKNCKETLPSTSAILDLVARCVKTETDHLLSISFIDHAFNSLQKAILCRW